MEKPRVEIDLLRDLSEMFKGDLLRNGYDQKEVNGITDHQELFIRYYNAARRLVGNHRRTVHKAREFVAPQDPDQAKALDTIERKLREGESIAPYLSRKIKLLSYNDHLLNDWNIHHLHLGTETEGDGFVERTYSLLYVVFGDTVDVYDEANTDAHLITVMSHSDFATQELLEIMNDNWPNLLQRGLARGMKGDRLSDDEIRVIRKNKLNYCIRLSDGKAYHSPGLGVNLRGDSALDVMRAIHRAWWTKEQQELVMSQMEGIIERQMSLPGGGLSQEVIDLRLQPRLPDGQWILVDRNSKYIHPLMEIG